MKYKLDYDIGIDKLKFLSYILDEYFFNILLGIIKNEKLDKYIRVEISDKIVFLSLNNNKFIENIILIVKDEKEEVYTRAILAQSLFTNQSNILGIELDWLDNYINEFNIKYNVDTFDYLYEYMDTIYNKMDKASDFLDKFYENNMTNNDFIEYYIKMENLASLFNKYNQNNNFLEIIIKNSLYNLKCIYLKNNKLYTIENGEEIHTQKKIDEKTLKI